MRTAAPGRRRRRSTAGRGEVAGIGPGHARHSGLPAERVVAALSGAAVPFSEVSAHRATLEEAYLELTRDAVDYRAEAAR